MNENHLSVPAQDAQVLGLRAVELGEKAEVLSRFAQESPELAQMAGVEVAALEAGAILRSGYVQRVASISLGAARSGRAATIHSADLESMTRLEAVVQLANARIGASMAMLDAQKSRGGMETLGSVIGLASGAIGLWKAIF